MEEFKDMRLKRLYHQMNKPSVDKSIYDLIISEDRENIKYATNYQRNFVWNMVTCTELIETILIHGIIPPLVMLETDEGIEIIEGRQRYESLLKFYNNKFKLKAEGLQELKKLEGKCYKDLDESAQTIFQNYKIRITIYSAKDRPDITSEDLNLFRHDAYERFKLGSSPLNKQDVARAKYQFDELTREFTQILKKDEDFFERCVAVLLPKRKQNLEYREKLNLVLVAIRKLIILRYIPIIEEKNVSFATKVIDDYYQNFIVPLCEEEKNAKIEEFKSIFNKIYELRQWLIQMQSSLKDNRLLFEATYWMLSILYNHKEFSDKFYHFNISQFYRYLKNDAEDYFNTYNSHTSNHIETRYSYICRYLCEELELNIKSYLEKVKDNKKIFKHKASKENEENIWNTMGSDRQAVPSNVTMTVNEIIRLIKKENLIVQPDFQRAQLRNVVKSSRIIESLILGVKLPPIYLYAYREQNGIEKYTVLDRATKNC